MGMELENEQSLENRSNFSNHSNGQIIIYSDEKDPRTANQLKQQQRINDDDTELESVIGYPLGECMFDK